MPKRYRKTLFALCISALYASAGQAVDYSWNSGTFSSQALPIPTLLTAPDTLTLGTSNTKVFDVDFENQSIVTWLGGTIAINSGTVTNSGSFFSSADLTMTRTAGSAGTFINTGSFTKNGGVGATTFGANITLINSGILAAQTGRIDYGAASQTFNAGTEFAGDGNHRVISSATFNDQFTSNGRVDFTNGVMQGNDASFVGLVTFTNGTLTDTWSVIGGSTLGLESANTKVFGSATVTNAGTISQTSGTLALNDATLVNQGVYDFKTDATITRTAGSAGTFQNDGIVRKTGGANAATFGTNIALISNSGTFEAQAGRIDYSASAQTFNAGTVFSGAGSHRILSSATFAGQFASNDNVELNGGTYTGNGASFTGTVQFVNGTLSGTWLIPGGSTLALATANTKVFGSATVTNAGTISQTSGTLALNDATLVNQGVYDFKTDATITRTAGSAGTFQNDGIVRKSAGDGAATFGTNIALISNGGTFEAQAGRIDYSASAQTFNAGTVFSGAGSHRILSSATFAGQFASNDNVELNGGTYTGNGASFTGTVQFVNGTLSGNWLIPGGSTLALATANTKVFGSATVTNAGTISQTSGTLALNDATLVNQGVYDFKTDATITRTAGSAGTFQNGGIVRKSAGDGAATFGTNIALISNGGTFEAQAGRIDYSAGAQTFNAGTVFSGAGSHRILSSATFAGQFVSNDKVELNGSTYTGNGASFTGTVQFVNGAVSGTWLVPGGSTLALTTGNTKVLGSGTITNEGLTSQSSGTLALNDGTLINKGTYEFKADETITRTAGASGSFVNQGVLRKSGGAGAATITSLVTLANQANGLISVESGRIATNGFAANEGTIQTIVGTVFSGTVALTNNGVIKGSGAVTVPSLINAGAVDPGASAGTLTINGAFQQTIDGMLIIEVGDNGVSDLLSITGTANLAGTLDIRRLGQYAPVIGDAFLVLTASNLNGTQFGPVKHNLGSGVDFDVIYSQNSVSLQITAVPEASTWVMMLAGLGLLGLGRNRRPSAGPLSA